MDYECKVYRQEDFDQTHYVFIMLRDEMVLDRVYQYHRASRRHRWHLVGKWSRISMREPRVTMMDKPSVPDDVVAEVRKNLSEIRIVV